MKELINELDGFRNLYHHRTAGDADSCRSIVVRAGTIFELLFKYILKERLRLADHDGRRMWMKEEEKIGGKRGAVGVERFCLRELVIMNSNVRRQCRIPEIPSLRIDIEEFAEIRNSVVHGRQPDVSDGYCRKIMLDIEAIAEHLHLIQPAPVHGDLKNACDLVRYVEELAEYHLKAKKDMLIENIALDMHSTFSLIHDFAKNRKWQGIKYRGLIINPSAKIIRTYCKPGGVSSGEANGVIKQYQSNICNIQDDLAMRNMEIEIRKYASLPVIHGFAINRSQVFWSLTTFDGGLLKGGADSYHANRIGKPNPDPADINSHPFFGWFDHIWESAIPV